MKKYLAILLLAFSGCGMIESKPVESGLELLFVYGTMKAIEDAPDPQMKAERIRVIASNVKVLLQGGDVHVSALQLLVDESLSGDLTPADLYLIGQVTILAGQFTDADGIIRDVLGAEKFLDDVIAVTEVYL